MRQYTVGAFASMPRLDPIAESPANFRHPGAAGRNCVRAGRNVITLVQLHGGGRNCSTVETVSTAMRKLARGYHGALATQSIPRTRHFAAPRPPST